MQTTSAPCEVEGQTPMSPSPEGRSRPAASTSRETTQSTVGESSVRIDTLTANGSDGSYDSWALTGTGLPAVTRCSSTELKTQEAGRDTADSRFGMVDLGWGGGREGVGEERGYVYCHRAGGGYQPPSV